MAIYLLLLSPWDPSDTLKRHISATRRCTCAPIPTTAETDSASSFKGTEESQRDGTGREKERSADFRIGSFRALVLSPQSHSFLRLLRLYAIKCGV